MYAIIINEETKEVNVGVGTDTEFYKSIGMEEMEVEQAYDGSWYVQGYAPEKPEIEKIKERVAELHSLLESTDWVANKITDLMVLKPEGYEETIEKYRDVLIKRQEYRDELNGLENLTSTR